MEFLFLQEHNYEGSLKYMNHSTKVSYNEEVSDYADKFNRVQ